MGSPEKINENDLSYSLVIDGKVIPDVMDNAVYKEIKEAIADQLGVDLKEVTDEAILGEKREEGGLDADSLDLVEVVMAIEEIYQTEGIDLGLPKQGIPDEEAEKIGRVRHVREHFNVRMAAKENPEILKLWIGKRKAEMDEYDKQKKARQLTKG